MNDILWLIIAILALVIELLTGTLVFLFFSISAVILSVMLMLGIEISIEKQLLVFALLDSIGMIFVYFRIKHFKTKQRKDEKSARESLLLNSFGITIENSRVSLFDGSYPYTTKNNETYPVGAKVIVKKVNGLSVEVEKTED